MNLLLRLNSIKVQSKRDLKSALYGLGMYFVLTVILLLTSSQMLKGSLFDIEELGITGRPNPILNPFFYTILLVAIYLGLCSAISISKERDMGTLEVLFYGPVDSISYVLAKYLHQMMVFVIALIFAGINFYLISSLTNLGFTLEIWGMMLLAVFVGSSMISFGILLSSYNKRIISSVIIFLVFTFIFLAFWVASNWMSSLTVFEYDEQAMKETVKEFPAYYVYIRVFLDKINVVMRWISPIEYFKHGSNALALRDAIRYWLNIVSSVGYTAILLILSVVAFNRKGVKR